MKEVIQREPGQPPAITTDDLGLGLAPPAGRDAAEFEDISFAYRGFPGLPVGLGPCDQLEAAAGWVLL